MVLHLAPQLVSQRVQAWLATPTQEPAAEPAHKAARQQGQSAGQRTPIIHAIDSIAVPLYVSLADIKLDLGSLQSLTPGAVVRLTHALEQPFDVCTADGSIVCTGYLGQSAAHRALGLLSVSTTSKSQD
jgi:flagellar motor switch/type III secretory pathway protein FliN